MGSVRYFHVQAGVPDESLRLHLKNKKLAYFSCFLYHSYFSLSLSLFMSPRYPLFILIFSVSSFFLSFLFFSHSKQAFNHVQEIRELLNIFLDLVRTVRNSSKSTELHAVLARQEGFMLLFTMRSSQQVDIGCLIAPIKIIVASIFELFNRLALISVKNTRIRKLFFT